METETNTESVKRKLPVGIIIVVLVVALVIGAGIAAWATGYLYVGFKNSKQEAVVHTSVCDHDVQKRFFDEYTNVSHDENKLKSIHNDITSDDNWEKDPNCLMIIFLYATLNEVKDQPLAQKMLDEIKDLSAKGINPSGEFFNPNWSHMRIMTKMVPGGIEGSGSEEV
ncbi:hypothetical protein FWC31_02810 [Candidatus Saccharibacteria bacterium]|nr:hypothetical protein [Candidatus Saccharibacteria bacterium]